MIDEKAIQAVTAKAIFDTLDSKHRDELIQTAILKIIEVPQEGSYGRKQPSLLQQAFNHALESTVRQIVFDKLKTDPEIIAQLNKIVAEATKKALFDQEEEMVASFANAIAKAMQPKDERY